MERVSHELISIMADMARMGAYVSEFVEEDLVWGKAPSVKIFFPDDMVSGTEEDIAKPYSYDSDTGLRPFLVELREYRNEMVYLVSKRDEV